MPGYARHVLVIEDDAETADQLVDCLKSSGYEVDLAVDGEDGLSNTFILLAYLLVRFRIALWRAAWPTIARRVSRILLATRPAIRFFFRKRNIIRR